MFNIKKFIIRSVWLISLAAIFWLFNDICFNYFYTKIIKNTVFLTTYYCFWCPKIPIFVEYLHYGIKEYFFCPPLAQDLVQFLLEHIDLTKNSLYYNYSWFYYTHLITFYLFLSIIIFDNTKNLKNYKILDEIYDEFFKE